MSARDAHQRGDAQFDRFRTRPGSDYIASGFALGRLAELVEVRAPRSILEIGAGIGAITATLLEARERAGTTDGEYVAVEDIPFCLEQLATNLGPQIGAITVVPRAAAIAPEHGPFDLVIIDGGATTDLIPEDRHLFPPEAEADDVRSWLPRIAHGGVVVAENVRLRQRQVMEAEVGRAFVHEHVRPLDGSPGLHIYRFEPDDATRARVRVREGLRQLWFGRGFRLAKRAWAKGTSRPFPRRSRVAPGEAGWD